MSNKILSKYVKPKSISAKVRLRKLNFANFLEYYHKGSALDDFLYKYLRDLVRKNKVTDGFKTPFNSEGFYFKTKDFVKCKNLSGRVCLLSDLLDQDITANLRIVPYDFVIDGQQLSGISVTLVEAQATMSDM